MRIGLITTINTNIGDDLIREGICLLLKQVFKNRDIQFISINKHRPFTAYPALHPIHLNNIAEKIPKVGAVIKNLIETNCSKLSFSRFDSCDLIVQCGSPVFWPSCYASEWAKPLWYDIIGRLRERIPVINIAAGSCYPWEKQPDKIKNEADTQYIRHILECCRLTTVRDKLSQKICKSFGNDVPLIPCTAFLAGIEETVNRKEKKLVLINYMAGGGHYDWDQGIDKRNWEKTVKTLISRLRKRHKIAFLCHDEKEFSLANKLSPELPRFFPKTPQEYFDCVSNAKFGIFNRMHASVGMAGLGGIPSIAVCTDTRLLMVSELGLKTYYVKNAEADEIEEVIESACGSLQSEQERMIALQHETREKYLNIIEEALL